MTHEPHESRVNGGTNCTIILFGASGDLSRRKLIPALYALVKANKFKKFLIIGAAKDQVTAQQILARAKGFIANVDEAPWQILTEAFHYHELDFKKVDDFKQLASKVKELEKKAGLSGNRIVYVAAASDFFIPITENCAASGLVKKYEPNENTWQRIVYEKPFGKDLASAQAINKCIANLFDEKQIFRIDHYLTKEIVGNIALVRFTNCVFEPLWDNRYIDNVQIILSEKVCIEGRGVYFDAYGALKDVVQNHMLQLVSLIAMEAPYQLTGEYIRNERALVLDRVRIVDGILGQCDTYAQEPGVKPNSTTETFAALQLMIDNPRWAGVPFYLRTGKCLNKKETIIHIKFKQVDCLLSKACPSDSNYLTIKVAPEASFALELNAKKVGAAYEVTPIKMEFCHSCVFGPYTPDAHEVLLEEIMRGEQAVSVRFDEIESAWKIIDKIKAMNFPLYRYKSGSAGPKEMETFAKKHGARLR